MPTLLSIVPSVPIRELDAALAFYRDLLGFRLRVRFGEGGAMLVRDGVELHLTRLDDDTWKRRADFATRPIDSGAESFLPGTSAFRIEVDDVRGLYDEIRARRALPAETTLRAQPWGDVDLTVADRDGNSLTFFERGATRSTDPQAP